MVSSGLISKTLSGLFNGISQQANALRLDNQGEQQVNMDSSLVEGLSKRPNLEYLHEIVGTISPDSFIYFIERGDNEQYFAIFTGNAVKPIEIYTLEGVECTVNYVGSAGSYISGIVPKDVIQAETIADYSIIANTGQTVSMDATSVTPVTTDAGLNIKNSALFYVEKGYPETNYKISVTDGAGTYTGSHTTAAPSANGVSYAKTDEIATALMNSITLPAGYSKSSFGSVVLVEKTSAGSFSISAEDSFGDIAIRPIKGSVQRMSKLPPVAPVGYVLEVAGDASTHFDNTYVKYEKSDSGAGVWTETVAFEDEDGVPLRNSFDGSTMPHQLVRTALNTFEFSPIDWSDRLVGDNVSSPYPSFVDNKISQVFFFKNRVGFISEESIALSRNSDYFNFWSSTATDVLENDPIDVTLSTKQVNHIKQMVPFNTTLLLFSANTQYSLSSGDGLLTPQTVSIDPVTHFDTNTSVQPVAAGANVYFLVNNGNYNGMREYFVQNNAKTNDAAEVTAHVPRFIPNTIKRLISSSSQNMILGIDDANPDIYVYKYFWNGDEKVQSAWFKWTYPEIDRIIDGFLTEDGMYLLVQRGTKVEIMYSKLDFSKTGNLDFRVYLDYLETITGGVYDPNTNKTRFTLPYEMVRNDFVVVDGITGSSLGGVTQVNSTTIDVNDNQEGKTLYVGIPYNSMYEFSHFYIRDGEGSPIIQGRIQLRSITLNYDETGYFKLTVDSGGGRVNTKEFTGTQLATAELGSPSLLSGSKKFSVLSKASGVSIKLESDSYLPFSIHTASFAGYFTTQTRPI